MVLVIQGIDMMMQIAGSGQKAAPPTRASDAYLDTCFGNGNGLLLHGLVDGHLILHIHLVKLVNAADAIVCQHQRSSLDAEIVAVRLLQRQIKIGLQFTFKEMYNISSLQ